MSHHFHLGVAVSHHLHFGSGFHRSHRVSSAVRDSAVVLITFALVVATMVIVSGVDALPGR